MQWVKCTERMPDDADKTSVSRDREFTVRWQDEDGNWMVETMTNKTFDKFYIVGEGYEWLEGAFAEEPKPSREEIIATVKETIDDSVPYVAKHKAFLITVDGWTKLAKIAKPHLTELFNALDAVAAGKKLSTEDTTQLLKLLEQ